MQYDAPSKERNRSISPWLRAARLLLSLSLVHTSMLAPLTLAATPRRQSGHEVRKPTEITADPVTSRM